MHVDPATELHPTSDAAPDEVSEPEPAYLRGFNNSAESEAIAGALPARQNSPLKVPYGLYAEQLNGTSFTVPRAHNRRAWLYRIMPSVAHGPFAPYEQPYLDLAYLGRTPTPGARGRRGSSRLRGRGWSSSRAFPSSRAPRPGSNDHEIEVQPGNQPT